MDPRTTLEPDARAERAAPPPIGDGQDPKEIRFRGLLEAAPDAMVISDRQGRIVLVNRQAETLFGYARGEMIGETIELLVPDRFRHRHVSHRQHYYQDPRTRPMGVSLDLYGRRKDGSEFPAEISLSAIEPAEEDFLVITAVRDVTDRKDVERTLQQTADDLLRANRELARSNAELEQFAYVASHDLQEPLRMVASYTQLLARRYRNKLDEDADTFISYAVDGATRMQLLISDLLTFSRVGTRGKPFEPTDCNALFDAVVADLSGIIEDANASVTRGELPTVLADSGQLRQVFQNLLSNAIKFHGPQAPRVHVWVEEDAATWRFAFQDNGMGIDPEYHDRIFALFQRLHTQQEVPGTGIGLAICKKIVERHGGTMWVESAPLRGATFWFTLPRTESSTP